MNIPGFERAETETAMRQIEGAEALLGIKFPAAYRDLIGNYGGAHGDADFVLANGTPASIGGWLSLSPWEPHSLWSALACWSEHGLPPHVVPFGIDGGGNYVCFYYRPSQEPSVVFWFHELEGEQGLQLVSPSFSKFLETLRAP